MLKPKLFPTFLLTVTITVIASQCCFSAVHISTSVITWLYSWLFMCLSSQQTVCFLRSGIVSDLSSIWY